MDEDARRFTGCDEGWFDYVDCMMHDEISRPGENFWCKVILGGDTPFASAALFWADEGILCISEYVVAPEFRGKGMGSAALRELLRNGEEIIGKHVTEARAVIFVNNPGSKRAFEKAGFRYESTHPDGDAEYYVYNEG